MRFSAAPAKLSGPPPRVSSLLKLIPRWQAGGAAILLNASCSSSRSARFQFSVAETGENLSSDRPFLKPGQTEVHNIVCVAV